MSFRLLIIWDCYQLDLKSKDFKTSDDVWIEWLKTLGPHQVEKARDRIISHKSPGKLVSSLFLWPEIQNVESSGLLISQTLISSRVWIPIGLILSMFGFFWIDFSEACFTFFFTSEWFMFSGTVQAGHHMIAH